MDHIDDTGCPEAIRKYVRNNNHIELTGYVRRGFNGEVYFAKRKKLGDEVCTKILFIPNRGMIHPRRR